MKNGDILERMRQSSWLVPFVPTIRHCLQRTRRRTLSFCSLAAFFVDGESADEVPIRFESPLWCART
ncbi:MAG: hypothetical protein AAGF97_20545, partial [Planctomycetota bacterium]